MQIVGRRVETRSVQLIQIAGRRTKRGYPKRAERAAASEKSSGYSIRKQQVEQVGISMFDDETTAADTPCIV
jgi:hypothetical protein